ncbi:MAG: S9 family peptidase [Phycisphaerae bacterium]
MRRVVTSLLLISLAAIAAAQDVQKQQIGQMVLEGVPAIDDGMRKQVLPYLEFRRAGLSGISEDGSSIIVSTRFGNTNQLHHVRSPLGARKQITFFDEPVNSGGFLPGTNQQSIIFAKDIGGNENFQYYTLDLATGRHTMLTDGKSRHESLVVARSGKRIAFSNNARDGKNMDVYLRQLDQPAAKILWQVEGSYTPAEFSPDESKLLVLNYISERQTRWFIVDVASGQNTQITPDDPPAYYGGATWSADGKSIYITTDRDGEFRKLYQLKVDFGEWRCLTPKIEWDIEDVAVDPAGNGIAYVVNEDGLSKLYFADAWGNGAKEVNTGLPPCVLSGLRFNLKGGVLGFTADAATFPGEAFTATFPEGKITRWTESEIGGLNASNFVAPTIIRWPTFDKGTDGKPRQISGFYYKGKGDGPRPVVIMIHGGPEGQFSPTFTNTIQLWANELGVSVIAPNVRGSTGYGKTFHGLDNGVLREDSVKDIGALLDWIEKQPELDKTRVAVHGGSYGGYMVLASLKNYPKRIRAGIDIVGIADFVSFLELTSEYRRDLRRAEYGDERVPEVRKVLEAISPLRNADKIESALFVVHGNNDPRVKVFEAEQIVKKMRDLKRPVWFANALDEGHGFQKKPNRDLAQVLYMMFYKEHLLQ